MRLFDEIDITRSLRAKVIYQTPFFFQGYLVSKKYRYQAIKQKEQSKLKIQKTIL